MIRNRLVDFLSGEVAKASLINAEAVKEGFASLSRENAKALLDAINAGNELRVGQIILSSVRTAHTKKAQDLVVTALADEELTFREVLKKLESL